MNISDLLLQSFMALQLLCTPTKAMHTYVTDLIVFSYDRPLQLHTLLYSLERYTSNINNTFVIYRTSNDEFETAYQEVYSEFQNVTPAKQETRQEFKDLVINTLVGSDATHVLFAVDDIIIKDYFDCDACCYWLEHTGAYGCYLRLGTHLNWCYPLNCTQKVPPYQVVHKDIYQWNFHEGQYDWNYPNTVDLTLYRMKDVVAILTDLDFCSPNSLEAQWAQRKPHIPYGIFFNDSKMINIPLNLVNEDQPNVHMNTYSTEELLHLFNLGYTIDIAPFDNVKNDGAHVAYIPEFIIR